MAVLAPLRDLRLFLSVIGTGVPYVRGASGNEGVGVKRGQGGPCAACCVAWHGRLIANWRNWVSLTTTVIPQQSQKVPNTKSQFQSRGLYLDMIPRHLVSPHPPSVLQMPTHGATPQFALPAVRVGAPRRRGRNVSNVGRVPEPGT